MPVRLGLHQMRHQRLRDALALDARHRSAAVEACEDLRFQAICLFRIVRCDHLIGERDQLLRGQPGVLRLRTEQHGQHLCLFARRQPLDLADDFTSSHEARLPDRQATINSEESGLTRPDGGTQQVTNEKFPVDLGHRDV